MKVILTIIEKCLAAVMVVFTIIFAGVVIALLLSPRVRPPCPADPNVIWTDCRGTRTWADGEKYTGEWKNNVKNGQGAETRPDGSEYVGEYRDNLKNGQGTFTSPFGTKYIGEFKDDQFSRGTIAYANGDKYTLENGTYVKSLPTGISIKIEGGTFIVPVTLNDKLTLDFTIDTGASDVAVTADVVSTLMRTGSITKADFLGQAQYQLGDGSIVRSRVFIIRSLKVGDKVVENVRAGVASIKGSLLLGQSFLNRFNSWSVDNRQRLLFLN